MKYLPAFSLALTILTPVLPLRAQMEEQPLEPFNQNVDAPAPVAIATAQPGQYESLPTLLASEILLPEYLQGANFTVQNIVPTSAGANQYTINSDFGVFTANGSQMLVRRVAEIRGIAQLQAMSQTKEFTDALSQAAVAPLAVAQNLVTDPINTISSVPRGIMGFLNRTGENIKARSEGDQPSAGEGNAIENMSGFSKVKRNIALQLGVDPYCSNQVFQQELSKVAWPAFLGKFTVQLGIAAVSGGAGTALSALNVTGSLADSLREKSPTDLRIMNNNLLTNSMGISSEIASAYLNNNSMSPTTQTVTVDALARLGNITGQADFIRQAATSTDEQEALSYQQSAQMMANITNVTPITDVTHIEGLTVCMTSDGGVIVPIQWDYVAWTPLAEKFIEVLKLQKFPKTATSFTVLITGDASPMAIQQLAARSVKLIPKGLPGPLL